MTSPRAARLIVGATILVSVSSWTISAAWAQHEAHGGGSSSGGGTAVSSGGSGGSGGGGSAGSGGSGGSSSSGGSSGGSTFVGTAVPRGSGGGKSAGRDAGTQSGSSGGGSSATGRRTRDGQPVVGTAVPRGSVPAGTGGGGVVFVPGGYGFYPWGYGGLGVGGYYGGYYGSYAYDPFDGFGGVPTYYFPAQSGGDDGAVRIKVKQRKASVYADGYFVGRVEDFDGVLQRLHLSAGPHRIEIREDGYEPLTFDVNVDPGHTVTYHGELHRTQ